VPLSVFRLNRLQTLHIENNGLAVLHNDIGYLDELEDLVCICVKLLSFVLIMQLS